MILSKQFICTHAKWPHEVFVETGAGHGASLKAACAIFKQCYSCEADADNFKTACQNASGENVMIVHDGSLGMLEVLFGGEGDFSILDKNVFFWLDAHWGGAGAKLNGVECPLLDELRLIVAQPWKKRPVVAIDDAYYFGDRFWETKKSKIYDRSKWPTLEQITDVAWGWHLEHVGPRGKVIKLS